MQNSALEQRYIALVFAHGTVKRALEAAHGSIGPGESIGSLNQLEQKLREEIDAIEFPEADDDDSGSDDGDNDGDEPGYRSDTLEQNAEATEPRYLVCALASAKTNSACTICLCKVKKQTPAYDIECGHRFHPECLEKWVMERPNCPTCRTAIVTCTLP
jgi:hypothetical protein